MCRLLKVLFPLLPKTTSSALRASIRKTILADIRTANLRNKNHKLNRSVQAMLFGMVERGMDGEVVGDKGKARAGEGPASRPDEAMWAIVLTKELWRKSIWCAPCCSAFYYSLIRAKERCQDCGNCGIGMLSSSTKGAECLLSFFPG